MPSPLTIMVVDDDTDGRFLLEHGLRKAIRDCAVVACTSADEALCLLKGTRIDALITDHRLGLGSGAEFISQARRRGVMCPILMVTRSDDPRVQSEAYAAGATEVFMGGRGDFADVLQRLLTRAAPENAA